MPDATSSDAHWTIQSLQLSRLRAGGHPKERWVWTMCTRVFVGCCLVIVEVSRFLRVRCSTSSLPPKYRHLVEHASVECIRTLHRVQAVCLTRAPCGALTQTRTITTTFSLFIPGESSQGSVSRRCSMSRAYSVATITQAVARAGEAIPRFLRRASLGYKHGGRYRLPVSHLFRTQSSLCQTFVCWGCNGAEVAQ